ncbi:MAG: hypothetical protein PHS78_09000 [Aliarcobacter skirrowii]|uniref:hypothetical protein n=1 Tax=Aliarcobacter skirrowii TaxID=28200 RepID=UPI00242FAB09|nr:hypothetical protein [Aliarcobacter skirrowii]MDD2509156.1 hypothetical protein [Aliarcobacter skirrowii]MDD3496527.1 hypothetical protein [Aliarcobacter skirrowii]
MQSIKLNIQDNLVEKVYDFLKTLPKNGIEIIETTYDKKDINKSAKFTAISIDTKSFKFDREEANAR